MFPPIARLSFRDARAPSRVVKPIEYIFGNLRHSNERRKCCRRNNTDFQQERDKLRNICRQRKLRVDFSVCVLDMLPRFREAKRHFSDPYLPAREVSVRATSSITALGARSRIVPRAVYNWS